MQDEENAYSVEKLWGMGPLKEGAPVENPEEVVNFERYKVTEGCIMIFTAHNMTWKLQQPTACRDCCFFKLSYVADLIRV